MSINNSNNDSPFRTEHFFITIFDRVPIGSTFRIDGEWFLKQGKYSAWNKNDQAISYFYKPCAVGVIQK